MPFRKEAIGELQTYLGGMSMREIARRSGINRATLGRYAKGELPQTDVLDTLYIFSRRMGAHHIEFYEVPNIEPPKTISEYLRTVASALEDTIDTASCEKP